MLDDFPDLEFDLEETPDLEELATAKKPEARASQTPVTPVQVTSCYVCGNRFPPGVAVIMVNGRNSRYTFACHPGCWVHQVKQARPSR